MRAESVGGAGLPGGKSTPNWVVPPGAPQTTTFGVRYPCRPLLFVAPVAPVAAQASKRRARACNGEIVTRRSRSTATRQVQLGRADAGRPRAASRGLHHVSTRPGVITAYLRVAVGDACTEFDRSESERLLRAQRFIASATVRRRARRARTSVRSSSRQSTKFPSSSAAAFRARRSSRLCSARKISMAAGSRSSSASQQGFGIARASAVTSSSTAPSAQPFTLAVGGELDPLGDACWLRVFEAVPHGRCSRTDFTSARTS